ncbi:MAG: TolB-like translocation protein [Planctomycetota bacterium]|jgi:hypothetical protein
MYHAFISDGRLYIHDIDGSIKEITSHFADEKAIESEEHKNRQGWKSKDNQDNAYWNMAVWGKQASASPFCPYRFTKAMVAGEKSLYYLITNNYITGLFKYDIEQDEEIRLFHRNNFFQQGIDYSGKLDQFVSAVVAEDGSVDIDLLDSQGTFIKTITTGDSRDSNPVFSRHDPNWILYQSSGIARNEEGFTYAYGPESINRIEIDSGEITEVVADYKYDYLLPKDDNEGNIYCIRRPYRGPGYRSVWQSLFYIVTFPVRFVIAIFKFLDAFTRLFNQKDLMLNGPQAKIPAQSKYVQVLGKTIDLAKVQRTANLQQTPSLVPGSWELVRITKSCHIEVLARRVCSYDIDQEGNIHFTNGFKVSTYAKDRLVTLFKHNIIEDLKVAKASG